MRSKLTHETKLGFSMVSFKSQSDRNIVLETLSLDMKSELSWIFGACGTRVDVDMNMQSNVNVPNVSNRMRWRSINLGVHCDLKGFDTQRFDSFKGL